MSQEGQDFAAPAPDGVPIMDKHARRIRLLETLGSVERLSVELAAAEFGVSTATIRRDFDELAQQQLLVRTHGGAIAGTATYELPLRYKSAAHAEEKRRIGAAAAKLVPLHSLVGMNGGTTTTEVARALVAQPAFPHEADGSRVTIVTNAVNIAHELAIRPEVKVVLTGGVARHRTYELVGPFARLVLDELFLDIAILGVNGLSVTHGASAENEEESNINMLLVERAKTVIVVADGSKLGRRAFARICPIESINTLVTDNAADDEYVKSLESAGIQVILA